MRGELRNICPDNLDSTKQALASKQLRHIGRVARLGVVVASATIDPVGASEWLVLGAALFRAEKETQSVRLIKRLLGDLRIRQLSYLHFRDLNPERKLAVCKAMRYLEARFLTHAEAVVIAEAACLISLAISTRGLAQSESVKWLRRILSVWVGAAAALHYPPTL
jgi:hypothetical protein